MKGNELDELFKDKLGHRKLTPPSGAWEQIEGNLSQKKRKGIVVWFAAAASFVLVFSLGWLLLPAKTDVQPVQTAQNTEQPDTTTELPSTDQVAEISDETRNVEHTETEESSPAPVIKTPLNTAANDKVLVAVQDVPEASNQISEPQEELAIERKPFKDIAPITLHSVSASRMVKANLDKSYVLPLDVSLIHTYSEEANEEIKGRKKFRVLNGIISIAKGVNKSKIGFEEIRNAKNNFIQEGLKYGAQETTEDPKKAEDEGTTNAGDMNKNAGDLK